MPTLLERQHQVGIDRISTALDKDVARLFAELDGASPIAVRDGLLYAAPPLVGRYGDASLALGMDFYEASREAAGVSGVYRVAPAAPPSPEQIERQVRWGVKPLFTDGDAMSARSLIFGGLQRIATSQATDTVTDNAIADPKAVGWKRIIEPGACNFCRMLHDRDAIYTKSSVRFASHDNCRCGAAPEFKGGRTVGPVPYRASKRKQTDSDRARVREYLAEMYTD